MVSLEEREGEVRDVFKLLRSAALIGLAWAAVAHLPGLARYLRMRAM